VACVKEACKEAGQQIKEEAGMRKAEERLKERETRVAVEKRMENLCMQRIYKMRLNREEYVVVNVRKSERYGWEKRR
jgi:hypothetical protein